MSDGVESGGGMTVDVGHLSSRDRRTSKISAIQVNALTKLRIGICT